MRIKAGSSGNCPGRVFPPLHRVSSDLCGVVVLSPAGPKPCQMRDRWSWWMRLFIYSWGPFA